MPPRQRLPDEGLPERPTSKKRRGAEDRSPISNALRYLGRQDHGRLVELLHAGIEWPDGDFGRALYPLTQATASLESWSAWERAVALAEIIKQAIEHRDVAPTRDSKRRRALQAGFRLPDGDIREPWGRALNDRFRQLKAVTWVFGDGRSIQPMQEAWGRGVEVLAQYLDQRLARLQDNEDWEVYRPPPKAPPRLTPVPPAPGVKVQPVFINYWVSTVFLDGRAFQRRITERLITAMEDGVDSYITRSRPPLQGDRPAGSVTRAWGCSAEEVPFVPHSDVLARLTFDRLTAGQQHWFATEAVSTEVADDRPWIYVRVNTWGIAAGQLSEAGLPISGLTIRLVFDSECLPADVWFYTDPADRIVPPAAGDPRRLRISNGLVGHTFEESLGPRDEVGLAFRWE